MGPVRVQLCAAQSRPAVATRQHAARAFLIESLPPPGDPYYEEYYEKPMPQVQTVAVMPEPMMSFPPPMPEPVVYMSPRVASPQPPARPKQRKWCVVI